LHPTLAEPPAYSSLQRDPPEDWYADVGLPITRDILLHILASLDTNTQEGATYHAAFCTAFAGFLRVGEFTWTSAEWLLGTADFSTWHATRRSVQFLDDDSRVYLTLRASKTDPFRMGITITIAAASDTACPVKSLRHLFEKYPLPTFSPLFTLTRDPTTTRDSAFTRTKIISRLRDILLELGVPGNCPGHSFRRGLGPLHRHPGRGPAAPGPLEIRRPQALH
jgi:hypothetical protein